MMIWKYDDPELFKNMSTSSPLDSKKSGGNPAMAGVFIPSDSPKLVSQLDVHESYVPQNEPLTMAHESWEIYGKYMGNILEIYGKYIENILEIYGKYMGNMVIYGNIWEVYGKYMGNIWDIYGTYMGHIWEIYGKYMGNMVIYGGLPSGNWLHSYGKWPSRNSGFTQLENGWIFHSELFVYQRVYPLIIPTISSVH